MINQQLLIRFLLIATMILAVLTPAHQARAHGGGILIQSVDNKITTNSDDESGSLELDVRCFSLLFAPTSQGGNNGPVDTPSFLSLATAPSGTDALLPGVDVYWDFLPMTINGTTSNLFYWDGVGMSLEDVEFASVPQANVTMSLFSESFEQVSVDGAADMVAGALVGTTDSTGSGLRLHAHRYFLLDDNDEDLSTDPPDGAYLIALQLRMPGYLNSDPFFVVAATFGLSIGALDSAALPWVEENIDSLVVEGDYDFDGDVDGADFLVWQRQYDSSGPFPIDNTYADGDGDGTVNTPDLGVWQDQYGFESAAMFGSVVTVPEPSAWWIMLTAIATHCVASRFTRTRQRV